MQPRTDRIFRRVPSAPRRERERRPLGVPELGHKTLKLGAAVLMDPGGLSGPWRSGEARTCSGMRATKVERAMSEAERTH